LGLSLVQAVAKLHGSALELSDQKPGLRVAMSMPLDAANTPVLAAPPQETAAAGDVIVAPTLASS
jgi:hypothetical protein